jgi:hypothetical protein
MNEWFTPGQMGFLAAISVVGVLIFTPNYVVSLAGDVRGGWHYFSRFGWIAAISLAISSWPFIITVCAILAVRSQSEVDSMQNWACVIVGSLVMLVAILPLFLILIKKRKA